MACFFCSSFDFPAEATSPASRMQGHRVVFSSPQCLSKAAVKSGLHCVSVTCPRWALFPVDFNNKRGLVEKSGIKTRQEVLTKERKYSRFSFMDSAKVLAA